MEGKHSAEKVLLEWEAPERVFIRREKKYFQNLFALLFIGAAIAVFFKEILLAAVLGVMGFFQYVMGTVPPGKMKNRITNHGIFTHGREYPWGELENFWFGRDGGEAVLHVDTKRHFPGRLTLVLGNLDKEKVTSVLERFIPLRRRPPEDPLTRVSSEVSRRIKL